MIGKPQETAGCFLQMLQWLHGKDRLKMAIRNIREMGEEVLYKK